MFVRVSLWKCLHFQGKFFQNGNATMSNEKGRDIAGKQEFGYFSLLAGLSLCGAITNSCTVP